MERGSCEMSSEGEGIGLGGPLGTTYEIMQPPAKSFEKSEGILRRLLRYRDQSRAKQFLPDWRVAICFRRVRPGRDGVEVYKGKEKAYYKGLMICGSIWVCPVCAAKISEVRRLELQGAMEAWKKQGGSVIMLTLTVPHYDHQPLSEVLGKFTQSHRIFKNRKTYKKITSEIGLVGSVRALEVTYGENGWHVHAHVLLFLKTGVSGALEGIEARMLEMWQSACLSAGLGEPDHHGVKVHDGTYADNYATKWGLDHEVTKSHIKKGREANLTPFDMLRQADTFPQAEAKFQEYARAFKGKRQLVWSDGLRQLLGLDSEKTDQEIASQLDEETVLLGSLTKSQWRIVLHADRRGELLEVAASSGWRGVLDYIQILIERE